MAQTAGRRPSIGGAEISPRHSVSDVGTRSDLVKSLISYNDLFDDIDKHPGGDVRHRFLSERSKRARYLEGLLIIQAHDVAVLENDVLSGEADPDDEIFLDKYDAAMGRLEEVISRISRAYEEDFKAVNAPVVEPHYMDNVHRWFLELPEKGLRGPNGALRSIYGAIGDPVSQDFMSLREGNDDFRRMILHNVMVPFNKHVLSSVEKYLNKLRGRSATTQTPGIGGKTLDILSTALECIVPIIFVAAGVTLIYNLRYTKDRMIAAPFVCFVCTIPIVFLSKDARFIFMLNAGIWAVIIVVVFLSEANLNSKASYGN